MRIGQVAVVDLVGVFRQFDALQFDFAGVVEDAQFDFGGVGGKQREVDPQPIPGRTEREGQAFTDSRRLGVRGGLGFFGRVMIAPAKRVISGLTYPPVGVSLLAIAVYQATSMLNVR